MSNQDLGSLSSDLYKQGRWNELIKLGEEHYPAVGSDRPKGIASLCYHVKLAVGQKRAWEHLPLWDGRAWEMCLLTSDMTTLAKQFIRPAFMLAEKGKIEAAKQVLKILPTLADDNEILGLYHEKFATIWAVGREFDDAISHYEKALTRYESASRRALKVRGGLIWARMLRDGGDNTALQKLTAEMEEIAQSAAAMGARNIAHGAVSAIEMKRSTNLATLSPFEVW